MSMRMAEAVMFDGEVFQQPRMPAVKETNMKKNPTMKRAIIARIISEGKENYRYFRMANFVSETYGLGSSLPC